MALRYVAPDGVKVYTISGGKAVPSWLSEKKKRALRKDEEYNRRVELIQDFEFPAACQRIKCTADGQYIFASGYHPPRVRVYDVNQLSLKFERHLDAEIVDFQVLSDDYSKAVFLCANRTLEFHAKFGKYHRTRVPRAGRAMAYARPTAELFVAGSAPELWRLSLEEGRYMAPLPCTSPGVNALGISPAHGLVAAAGEDGFLECFDPRARAPAGSLNAAAAASGDGQGLTALRFDDSGMQVAVGTSGGLVAVFDLRSQRPMVVKDHQYDAPIRDIKWPATMAGRSRQLIASSDRHIIKLWEAGTGRGFTNIEPKDADINDVCIWPDSGLILAGADTQRIQAYFLPALGPAPKWCSFLESMTEELEETAATTVYDDYRFITRSELDKLGLAHLVGTSMLKPYMHGFFVDARLHGKAKAAATPFAYEEYRAQRVAQKLEEERKSRISLVKKAPKVNAAMAARLLDAEAGGEGKKGKGEGASLLADDRFAAMFRDEEFAIDEASKDYKALHPNAGKLMGSDAAKSRRLVSEHFEPVSDEEDSPGSAGEEASDFSDDDNDDRPAPKKGKHGSQTAAADEDNARTSGPRMYEAKDATAAHAFTAGRSLADERAMPLGERLASGAGGKAASRHRFAGNREMSFKPYRAPDASSGEGGSGRGSGGRGSGGRGRGRGRSRGGGSGRGRGGGRRR